MEAQGWKKYLAPSELHMVPVYLWGLTSGVTLLRLSGPLHVQMRGTRASLMLMRPLISPTGQKGLKSLVFLARFFKQRQLSISKHWAWGQPPGSPFLSFEGKQESGIVKSRTWSSSEGSREALRPLHRCRCGPVLGWREHSILSRGKTRSGRVTTWKLMMSVCLHISN